VTAARTATIDNGHVRAVVHLPDANQGFYRGTRFDWAGILSSLTAYGVEFFGPWLDVHDPLRHDSITGLPEEFQAFPEPDIDYPLAQPGADFLRLGVGLLRKPSGEDTPFERFRTYEIVSPGEWSVKVEPAAIHFRHAARSSTGMACVYEKTLRLLPGFPTLLLEHRLRNTGTRPIQTFQYNHNFFRIGACAPGAEMKLRLPFSVKFPEEAPEFLAVNTAPHGSTELALTRVLNAGERILTELNGFDANKPYTMSLHHRATGASVYIDSDRPLSRFLFWATPKTFCAEPYVAINAAPGKQTSWTLRYEFHRL